MTRTLAPAGRHARRGASNSSNAPTRLADGLGVEGLRRAGRGLTPPLAMVRPNNRVPRSAARRRRRAADSAISLCSCTEGDSSPAAAGRQTAHLPHAASARVGPIIYRRLAENGTPSSSNRNAKMSVCWAIRSASGVSRPWPESSLVRSRNRPAGVGRLQPGRHLARLHRVDARVVRAGQEQHGRVVGAVLHVVVRRVGAAAPGTAPGSSPCRTR